MICRTILCLARPVARTGRSRTRVVVMTPGRRKPPPAESRTSRIQVMTRSPGTMSLRKEERRKIPVPKAR